MSKETQAQLISALIVFVVTVLGIFGYNIVVVQPAVRALAASCGGG